MKKIDAFSESVEDLTQSYNDSRNNLEHMMGELGNILLELKNYKKLI